MSIRKLHVTEVGYSEAFLGFNIDRSKTPFTILGVPLDISTSFRGGSSMAPARIRAVSKSLELCSILTEINMESIGFEDVGNIVLPPGDMLQSLNIIEGVVRELMDSNRTLFLLGGEHTLTLPSFKSFSTQNTAPCILVFDAHTDLRDEYLGSRYNHATVMKRIIDEIGGRIVLIGARAISKEEAEIYKRFKDYIDVVRVWRGSLSSDVGKEILKKLESCRSIYVSIDMDILDPAYAPGVQTPEPLGLDPSTLLTILTTVIDDRVRVVDVVEITPQFDKSDITAFLAARIIIEIAALIYRSKYLGERIREHMCW